MLSVSTKLNKSKQILYRYLPKVVQDQICMQFLYPRGQGNIQDVIRESGIKLGDLKHNEEDRTAPCIEHPVFMFGGPNQKLFKKYNPVKSHMFPCELNISSKNELWENYRKAS